MYKALKKSDNQNLGMPRNGSARHNRTVVVRMQGTHNE